MIRYILLFLLLFPIQSNALIYGLDLSKTIIEKDSNFTGDEILLSGLIRGGNPIIASVTGPNKGYDIWKKGRKMGMWVNEKRLHIPATFSYYQIYATDSLEKITDYDTLKMLNFDLNYDDYFAVETYSKDEMKEFNRAFKHYQQSVGQYLDSMNPIEVIGGSIFKIRIKLHENAPVGEYNIKIAEFENGRITQTENLKFEVKQTQLYADIDNYASNHPLLYALAAIFLAIFIGGVVGLLFNGVKV